ncbi:MAG: hypothetical protein KC417_16130, partial [Myxococcales bacterium]|nr:hypothetical protein [Myxococcales bacterium]
MRPSFARPLGLLATVTAAAGLALAATLGTAPWRTTVLGHAVEFADPAWFLGALTVPWLAWVVARWRTGSTAGKRALTFCLRTLVLLCLLAALARPNVVLTNHDRSVVILIDRSASIDAAQRAELDTFANTVRARAG